MAIDHKTITNLEKHTPKGYPDTGSPGTNHVYQYSGSALEFGLVDTGNIASSAVTTVKLDNGSVTNAKVATGTLGAEKFQTGSAEDAWVTARVGYNLTEYAATGKSITIFLFDDSTPYARNDNPPVEIPGTATINRSGTIRVTYDYTIGGGSSSNANIKVYRNGSMVAESDFGNAGTASHDISVSSGDVISFRIGDDAGDRTAIISNRVMKATTDLSV